MKMNYHFNKEVLVIEIPDRGGRLTDEGPSAFVQDVLQLGRPSQRKIAFDMSRMSYLNSTGLGDLVKIKDTLADQGIDLILIKPSARVTSLLSMAGIDQFFNIIDSEDAL